MFAEIKSCFKSLYHMHAKVPVLRERERDAMREKDAMMWHLSLSRAMMWHLGSNAIPVPKLLCSSLDIAPGAY